MNQPLVVDHDGADAEALRDRCIDSIDSINFIHVIEDNKIKKAIQILQDPSFDPGYYGNYPLVLASRIGRLKIVETLLGHEKIDPSINGSLALYFARMNDCHKIVLALLKNDRVDPSYNNNEILKDACRENKPHIVKLVLGHKQTDPNDAIGDIVEPENIYKIPIGILLFKDPRTNVADHIKLFLDWAGEHHQHKNGDYLITMVVRDERVSKKLIMNNKEIPKWVKNTIRNETLCSRRRMSVVFSYAFRDLPFDVLNLILSYTEPYNDEEIKIFGLFIQNIYKKRIAVNKQ